MSRRPMLQRIPCRSGCGRMLSSLVRPIHSSAATHAKYAGICGNCMTQEEKDAMLADMTHDVLGRVTGAGKAVGQ